MIYLASNLDSGTFAIVTVDQRGFRRLIHEGFRFGMHYQHANDEISWRCTTRVKNRNGRCGARIRTRVINGYEMITFSKGQNTNVEHDHQ